jgi:general secretion pathway protein L
VWSQSAQEIIASGRLADATELAGLAARINNRIATVLVPACDVILKEVALPTKPNRQLLQAIPYMLEEEQAEDIESLLVVFGQAQAAEFGYLQQVAVVRREQFVQWLSWVQDAGFNVKRMVPDALMLPELAQPVAVELGGQWLLKQQPWQVSCIDESWWPDYLGLLQLPELLSYSPWPAGVLQAHQLAPAELPLALLAKQLDHSTFTLLQGEFAPKKAQNKTFLQWRSSLILAAACGVLYLGSQLLATYRFNQQATMAQTEATSLYKAKFPQERITNLKRQVERKLAAAGGSSGSDLLGYLALVQPAISKAEQMSVDNFRFDQKKAEFKFQATAADFQSFEQLKNQLQQQGQQVEQGALSQVAGKVQGTMTLRSKS